MINSYTDYLDMPNHLTVDAMHCVHLHMRKSLTDDIAKELYEDLVKSATKYASHRMNWLLYDRCQRMEYDKYRTSSHDALLAAMNSFSRYIRNRDGKLAWDDDFVISKDDNNFNRKKVGDFACYIAFINGLNAR